MGKVMMYDKTMCYLIKNWSWDLPEQVVVPSEPLRSLQAERAVSPCFDGALGFCVLHDMSSLGKELNWCNSFMCQSSLRLKLTWFIFL